MAKKKSKTVKRTWKKDPAIMTDELFLAMRDAGIDKLGRTDIAIGADCEAMTVGLPLPSLALRYLFQSTVFSLGRIIQLIGKEGSCKSAFLYELYRWHCVYGGGYAHIENENKDSPLLRNSILERNPVWTRRGLMCPSRSLEEWQNALTYYTDYFMTEMNRAGGPGRILPTILGVDSLTGTSPEAEQAKTVAEGHASRGYPLMANLITRYMRDRSTVHRGYPITIASTNHLKVNKDDRGMNQKTTPSSGQVDFMATYIIEMARAIGGGDIDQIQGEKRTGLRLSLTATKNSLGPSRRRIDAEFIWWWERDEQDHPRQCHRWDWDTAAIEMLVRLGDNRKADATEVNKIIHLNAKKTHPRTVWSKTLGIPEASPLSWREAGQILESRTDILHALYPELGILEGYYFQPGIDYRQMEQDLETKGAQEAALLYSQAPENMPELDPDDLDPANQLGDDTGGDAT